jgi:hypothetical protein
MVVTLQDARFLSHGEMHKDEENSTGELKALNTPTPDNTNGQARGVCLSRRRLGRRLLRRPLDAFGNDLEYVLHMLQQQHSEGL